MDETYIGGLNSCIYYPPLNSVESMGCWIFFTSQFLERTAPLVELIPVVIVVPAFALLPLINTGLSEAQIIVMLCWDYQYTGGELEFLLSFTNFVQLGIWTVLLLS